MELTIKTNNISYLEFTISNIDVSIVNSIRRTILTEIPCVVFNLQTCNILVNNTRYNNEVLKQQLSCIPIHIKDFNELNIYDYQIVLNEENKTDKFIQLNSSHFKIINKKTKKEISSESIFPPYISPFNGKKYFIELFYLENSLSENIQGGSISFTCDMKIDYAKNNGSYNVVSNCTYTNTIDVEKQDEIINNVLIPSLKTENIEDEIKNWKLLEGRRCFISNSFEFVIESLDIYTSEELLLVACDILINQLSDISNNIIIENFVIKEGIITYEISLKNINQTIGTLLKKHLYNEYYGKIITYISVYKVHPHDIDMKMNISYIDDSYKESSLLENINKTCITIIGIINNIKNAFI